MRRVRVLPVLLAFPILLGCGSKPGKPTSLMEESLPGVDIRPARERVGRGADSMASKIDKTIRRTTIEAMTQLRRPNDLAADGTSPAYQDRRVAPFETSVWKVQARLIRVIHRPDDDIYLVLEDSAGREVVAEAPAPYTTAGTPFEEETTNVYRLLEGLFGLSGVPKEVNREVTVVGVGFFGKASNRQGAPHNGARLMPILGFTPK